MSEEQEEMAAAAGSVESSFEAVSASDDGISISSSGDTSRQIVVWLEEAQGLGMGGVQAERHAAAKSDRHLGVQVTRPFRRPPTPVLTALDDGSIDSGEQFRLRGDVFTIGRKQGDIVLSHDSSVSGIHAQIRRQQVGGKYVWYLTDLDTRNGTFVRSARAALTNQVMILGSRRFVLDNPLASLSADGADSNTNAMAVQPPPESIWPTLREFTTHERSLAIPIKHDRSVIGRAGSGAEILLDDPLIDHRHAILQRTPTGVWMISSLDTLNGIWVTVPTIQLTTSCHFQCGEQRFHFALP